MTELADIVWIAERPVKLDWGGPVDVPYRPLPADFKSRGFVHIQQIAREWPDKIAVDDGSVRLSYADLVDRIHGLVARLEGTVPPGGVVASVVRNTAVAPIIILACTTLAITLVPIDATHPRERQAALFGESGAQAVMVQAGVEIDDSFIPATLPRIAIDPAASTGGPPAHYRPDSDVPIFVTFTSGSTGRPKGLAYGDDSRSNVRHFIDALHLNADDVILGIASLSTGGARDAAAAVCTGATIRIVDLKTDGIAEALRVMAESGVTILSFVPSVLRSIMQIPGAEESFRRLRVLDLYGERILASDIALFRAKLPAGCHIRVTLASIEVDAVFSWYVQDHMLDGPVVPVGWLAAEKQIALLDAEGRPVPPGEVGEVLVRGPMAMGGWRAGQLTPGPFLRDPADPGRRVYPLGDLIRLRPDGLAEYVGRRDRQVKIRGLWADLGEIEAALRTINGVADAVAIGRSRPGGADHLIAFVVMAPGVARPGIAVLRRAVVAETAEHMAPAQVHFLDAIPRLAGHKPDLLRLDALAAQR